MGYMEGDQFGVKARIFRISFSGELAYEVNVESDNGNFMWEKIMEVGQELKIQPYGTEALSCLLYTSPSPRDLSTSRMPSSA